jgi:MFS family permease
LLALGFAGFSLCSTLPQFYALAVVVGIGHAGSHLIPVSTLVSRWFDERRGTAMGIVYTATGAGGLLFNPLGEWLIRSFGWRATFVILGAVIALVATPTALLLLRSRPEGSARKGEEPAEVGQTLGAFARSGAFWMIGGMIFLLNTLNSGIQQHLIPYLEDLGHSSTFAAAIMSAYLGMTIVGKVLLGSLSDRRGLARGFAIFSGVLSAGIALLFGVSPVAVAVLWALVYGTGNAVQTVVPPLVVADCAGPKHFATIYAVLSIFQTLGTGLGMPLSGYIHDWTGSYRPSFPLYLGMAGVATLLGLKAMAGAPFAKRAPEGAGPPAVAG